MLNLNQDGLQIFDRFEVDSSLPKHGSHKGMMVESTVGGVFIPTTFSNNGVTTRVVSADGNMASDDMHQLILIKKDSFKEWLGRKFSKWGNRLTGREETKKTKKILRNSDGTFTDPSQSGAPKISIEEFFKSIKNSKAQMDKIDGRIEAYEHALKQAADLGQVALRQELERKIEVVRSESQLFANNIVKVVLEKQVVEFYKSSERGVRLDWIKNFTRTIPEKFVNIKKKLDDLKIFDNYVIMHYDPNEQAYKMTDEEKEAAKDPILFGVIQGSRKLYYIGDWVDEYCDLTLDAFIDKFGKDAMSKNNITTNIDVNFGDTTLAESEEENS